MATYSEALDEAYKRAKETHPELRRTFNEEFKIFQDFAESDSMINGWVEDEVGGWSTAIDLAKALFSSEGVMDADDSICRMFWPVAYFPQVPSAKDGGKVKGDLTRLPGVLIVTDDHLVINVLMGGGWTDMTWERSSIKNPRFVTLGGMLVVPKFWCMQIDSDGDHDTLGIMRGMPPAGQEAVRSEILDALTG